MKKLILLLILFFFCAEVFAQKDSLKVLESVDFATIKATDSARKVDNRKWMSYTFFRKYISEGGKEMFDNFIDKLSQIANEHQSETIRNYEEQLQKRTDSLNSIYEKFIVAGCSVSVFEGDYTKTSEVFDIRAFLPNFLEGLTKNSEYIKFDSAYIQYPYYAEGKLFSQVHFEVQIRKRVDDRVVKELKGIARISFENLHQPKISYILLEPWIDYKYYENDNFRAFLKTIKLRGKLLTFSHQLSSNGNILNNDSTAFFKLEDYFKFVEDQSKDFEDEKFSLLLHVFSNKGKIETLPIDNQYFSEKRISIMKILNQNFPRFTLNSQYKFEGDVCRKFSDFKFSFELKSQADTSLMLKTDTFKIVTEFKTEPFRNYEKSISIPHVHYGHLGSEYDKANTVLSATMYDTLHKVIIENIYTIRDAQTNHVELGKDGHFTRNLGLSESALFNFFRKQKKFFEEVTPVYLKMVVKDKKTGQILQEGYTEYFGIVFRKRKFLFLELGWWYKKKLDYEFTENDFKCQKIKKK